VVSQRRGRRYLRRLILENLDLESPAGQRYRERLARADSALLRTSRERNPRAELGLGANTERS
jgi:hypothetical protein